MEKRGLGIIGLLAIGGALVLSGCGGSSGGGERLTKAQFAAKANALCVSFNKANKEAGTPTSLADTVTYFEKLIPVYEKRVAELAKLKPPADEEATVSRIVVLEKKEVGLANQLLAALKKNDVAAANKLVESGNANSKEAKGLYKKVNITECAK